MTRPNPDHDDLTHAPLPDSAGGISRKIFHCVPDAGHLPEAIQRNLRQLQAQNPGWEQCIMDDRLQAEFIQAWGSPRVRAAYQRLHPAYGPARADLFRYFALYVMGGVYFDQKSGLQGSLDALLRPDDQFLLGDGGDTVHPELARTVGGEYIQWFLAASPRHPLLAAVLHGVLQRIEHYSPLREGVGKMGVLRVTGPIAYTQALAPVLSLHPHRAIVAKQVGLLYTTLERETSHMSLAGRRHYSELTAPVVRADPAWSSGRRLQLLAQTLLAAVPERLRILNRRRVARRRQALG
ncbi:MAG: hypothetical protein EKK45_12305 [Curvibacter sp.]|nr:MAG: hypothetical protein EKK45_12305 [Curvibacter sp.]